MFTEAVRQRQARIYHALPEYRRRIGLLRPDPHHHPHQKYRWSTAVRTLHAKVTPESVQDLFAQGNVAEGPDVLSIDIDGGDYWVWQAIERYQPRVVVIEYNSALDPDERLVHGELAGVNAFFVHTSEAGEFPAPGAVQRRGPNYYLGAFGHPPGDDARPYQRV